MNIISNDINLNSLDLSSLNYQYGIELSGRDIKMINDVDSELKNQIREKILRLQGYVLELQRKAGKNIDFNETLYKELENTEKSINDVLDTFKTLTEQIEYTKEILDAVKTSQEIADGYKEYEDKKKTMHKYGTTTIKSGQNILNIGNATPTPLTYDGSKNTPDIYKSGNWVYCSNDTSTNDGGTL